jgi:hypothetical protein
VITVWDNSLLSKCIGDFRDWPRREEAVREKVNPKQNTGTICPVDGKVNGYSGAAARAGSFMINLVSSLKLLRPVARLKLLGKEALEIVKAIQFDRQLTKALHKFPHPVLIGFLIR